MRKNFLSIVITSHHEGEIIKDTLESLLVAARELDSIGIGYDFFVNIDNGNDETIKWVGKYVDKLDIKVFYTKYGDPGLARNSIIRKTDGEYLALIDADDMVTSGWFVKAMRKMLGESGEVLLHPEAELRFNDDAILSIDIRVDSVEQQWMNVISLFADNRWCSVVLGKRRTFLKYNYSASKNGYGYEDYYFNCISTNGGVRHLVVPGTTTFLLQKAKSVTARTRSNHDVLPYVELFELKKMQSETVKNGLPELPKQLRFVKMPDFVLEGMKEIKKNNSRLEKAFDAKTEYVVSKNGTDEEYLIGTEFCKMIEGKRIRHTVKTIAFVGNLVEAQEVKRRYGGRVVYLFTEQIDNVPLENNTLDFNGYFGWMYDIAKKLVLSRLMVQGRVRRLVLNNDRVVNEWVQEHKNYLSLNGIKVDKVY